MHDCYIGEWTMKGECGLWKEEGRVFVHCRPSLCWCYSLTCMLSSISVL